MPLHKEINKVLIIGAGPRVVGEVMDMDILIEQALDALVEENIQVVLVNPNPATIETDPHKNVKVYLEPLTITFLKRIIRMEKPNALLPVYGGKPALKLTNQLVRDGIIDEMDIELLNVNKLSLKIQDHKTLHDFLEVNNLPVANQWMLDNDADTIEKLASAHYPLLLTKKQKYRPDQHHSLNSFADVKQYFENEQKQEHFDWHNYLLNEDLSSWEELIFNVIRDNHGNYNFFNNMGSMEPVGITANDSLLVSPILTRNNNQIQKLRNAVKKIAKLLHLHGTLVVHFAVKQEEDNFLYKILMVKPRLTETTLLGYRTGIYSIGYINAKVALGYNLNEVIDPQSKLNAVIEPVKDAIGVKLPFWSFVESGYNHYHLGTQETSGGAALGIGRNFETAFLKAIHASTNFSNNKRVWQKEFEKDREKILLDLNHPQESHLITLLAAIANDIDYQTIHDNLHIHPIFLQKFTHIVILIKELKEEELTPHLLLKVKKNGFSNKLIASLTDKTEKEITALLEENKIYPSYLEIDGTAGIESPKVNAVYSAYDVQNEIEAIDTQNKCLILGLKPFQVSQNEEFDYMLYHAAKTLKENGISPIILSNNPECISNSYDVCDRIYFDPITLENILAIARKENIHCVLTQFSGKQVNQYRQRLLDHNIQILGQENLSEMLHQPFTTLFEAKNFKHVPFLLSKNEKEILDFADKFHFPVLIGGINNHKKSKSAVVFDLPALKRYISENELDQISISKFIEGEKYEVTALSDGNKVTIPGIIEHFEQTGSHASDSIAVFKPQNLTPHRERRLKDAALTIAHKLHLKGPINLHFLFKDDELYLLQAKTYAGHNVAFLSKSLHTNIVKYGTELLLGKTLSELNLQEDSWSTDSSLIHIKMPVFSLLRYQSENTFDSKMKTSGSVIGSAKTLPTALYKGYEASDLIIPSYGTVFISVRDQDKEKAIKLARRLHKLGFNLLATEGTATTLAEEGITTGISAKIQEGNQSLLEKIVQHKINMVINVKDLSDSASHDAILIQDAALSTHIPVFSTMQSIEDIVLVLETMAMSTQPL
ncbi:carbamoyl phosphate synthase large subunit [Lactobacillus sp. PV034]|uniref:carbamoyl phosphate synthase large subunit n=1 Tax=Lactobacillus sp. PV034 TaxID=2594495 RepID=UPI00223F2E0A|nr:carbamoyl phosphate synthase large subunit [Lactobacillus sp. PV034]QNQ80423.1 carbamoyl phosphate synthase large subunit [Lactobacillus sp. PV034]